MRLVLGAAFVCAWVEPHLAAQDRVEFEVTTVKPSKSLSVSLQVSPGGTFNAIGTSVSGLLKFAYDVHPRQIIGGPAWLEADKYDVTDKPETAGTSDIKQLKVRVQKLLADRFELAFHRDKKELSVYAIAVMKSGAKLTKNDGDPNGLPKFSVGRGELRLTNATMAEFASILQASILDRPTLDQTSLGSQRYDFSMKWTPDTSPASDNPNAPPDLYTAFHEQLGLKLEATKAPADVIVIDRVERPSAN